MRKEKPNCDYSQKWKKTNKLTFFKKRSCQENIWNIQSWDFCTIKINTNSHPHTHTHSRRHCMCFIARLLSPRPLDRDRLIVFLAPPTLTPFIIADTHFGLLSRKWNTLSRTQIGVSVLALRRVCSLLSFSATKYRAREWEAAVMFQNYAILKIYCRHIKESIIEREYAAF